MNPIEMAFSKIKAFLRANPTETFESIVRNLGKALDSFTAQMCSNLFAHAQYVTKLNKWKML